MKRLTPRALPTTLILLAFALAPCAVARQQQQPARDRGVTAVRRAPAPPRRAWPERSKRWALVIGVDEYDDGQISRLGGAANDARALHDALVEHAGFPAEQVTLLSSTQERGLQPRRNTILRYLSNLRANVPKDGLLLLAFSGHGIERGGRAFLLPADAEWSNDVRLLQQTAIEVGAIRDDISDAGVGQVVLLLDACRNNPEPGRSGGDNRMTRVFAADFDFAGRNREVVAFAAFYAAAVGERAYEYRAKGQGYFTWAVVEGLRGGAANERGEVTLAALARYVQEKVPRYVQRDLGAEGSQRPFSVIEGYLAEELVIAAAAPKSPAAADDAGRLVLEEASLWGAIKDSRSAADFEGYLRRYPAG
ncbi:MAG TPA: caspase family protein, partial [Pyrinomonadaceae bacterium]